MYKETLIIFLLYNGAVAIIIGLHLTSLSDQLFIIFSLLLNTIAIPVIIKTNSIPKRYARN